MREDWWPDWRGATVVIAASGPSQRREDIKLARGRAKVMAINCTWQIAPAADVLYACDPGWWKCEEPGYGQHAFREFQGLFVAGRRVEGAHSITVNIVNDMIWTGVEIGGGGNSAFQAMNLAVLWGADRVLLTGVDCFGPGQHWHGPHTMNNAPGTEPFANSRQSTIDLWIEKFGEVAPAMAAGGVEIFNCTRETALKCFPRAMLEDVL